MNTVEYNNIVSYSNFFSNIEIDLINKMASNIPPEEGLVGGEVDSNLRRNSIIKWIEVNDDNEWLFAKIYKKMSEVNNKHFHLNVTNGEPLQYTVYESPGGTYGQHADIIAHHELVRKISCTIQLSDEEDYEGGDLICYKEAFDRPIKLQKDKGSISFFLSSIIHEVTPVTKGTRVSLVCWFSGPPLK